MGVGDLDWRVVGIHQPGAPHAALVLVADPEDGRHPGRRDGPGYRHVGARRTAQGGDLGGERAPSAGSLPGLAGIAEHCVTPDRRDLGHERSFPSMHIDQALGPRDGRRAVHGPPVHAEPFSELLLGRQLAAARVLARGDGVPEPGRDLVVLACSRRAGHHIGTLPLKYVLRSLDMAIFRASTHYVVPSSGARSARRRSWPRPATPAGMTAHHRWSSMPGCPRLITLPALFTAR